jgi:hypothetical protein
VCGNLGEEELEERQAVAIQEGHRNVPPPPPVSVWDIDMRGFDEE